MKRILKSLAAIALVVSTMTVMAAANSNFMPSVEYKGAPEILEAIDASGKDVLSWVIVTPYSQRHTLPDHHNDSFIDAYGEVDTKELYQILVNSKEKVPESAEQLVVTDLFYVHEFEDREMIENPVEVTFQTKLGPHAYVKVFEYVDGEWQLLPVTLHADGTISVKVNQWGPFAIVSDVKEESSSVSSPQTGVTASVLPLAAAVVCVGLAAIRKRNANG